MGLDMEHKAMKLDERNAGTNDMMAVVCPRNQKLTSQHFVADARIRNGSAAVNKRRDRFIAARGRMILV